FSLDPVKGLYRLYRYTIVSLASFKTARLIPSPLEPEIPSDSTHVSPLSSEYNKAQPCAARIRKPPSGKSITFITRFDSWISSFREVQVTPSTLPFHRIPPSEMA